MYSNNSITLYLHYHHSYIPKKNYLPAFRGEGYGNGVPGLVLGDIAQGRGPCRVRVGAKRGGGVRVRGAGSRRRCRGGGGGDPAAGPAMGRRLPGLGQRERVAGKHEVHAVHVRPVRHNDLAAQQAELDAQQRLFGVPVGHRLVHNLQGSSFLEQLPCLNCKKIWKSQKIKSRLSVLGINSTQG